LIIFFETSKINAVKQKNKLINIASWPNITIVPVKKGKGMMLPPALFCLLLSSINASNTNTTKLTLQINAILENNFIN
jgi:hypothetical protein